MATEIIAKLVGTTPEGRPYYHAPMPNWNPVEIASCSRCGIPFTTTDHAGAGAICPPCVRQHQHTPTSGASGCTTPCTRTTGRRATA